MLSKKELRRTMKARLAALPPESFHGEGAAAAALLTGSAPWSRYGTVLLFLSMKNEIDTLPLLEAAFAAGKRVFLPCLVPENAGKYRMVFLRASAAAGPWIRGPFGIREPGARGPAPRPEDFPALIIVPGLAFDRAGRRLGRGGGYYDRFLAKAAVNSRSPSPNPAAGRIVGLCMEAQVLDEVPAGPEDKRMDGLASAAGLILFT
jgi:5-formyltetrahydrofolate cyclo-ligase